MDYAWCCSAYWRENRRKQFCSFLSCKPLTFVMEPHFYLEKKKPVYKLWLFQFGYLAYIFWKLNEVSLWLQGKQLTVLPMEKKSNFEMKISIWKKFHSKFDSFPIFKDCTTQIGDITKCDFFWFCIVKWVNI